MSSFLARRYKPAPLPLPNILRPLIPLPTEEPLPAPTSRFAVCIQTVLLFEGGFSDSPADPGGATNLGITLDTLAAWRGKAVTAADVKALAEVEAVAIYRAKYWLPIRGDDLPPGVDLAVLDAAVNSGPERALMWLQGALGVEKDGKIGPVTIAAAKAQKASITVAEVCDRRLAFLQKLGTWPTFGKGWSRRVEQVRAIATKAAIETPASGPPLPLPDGQQRRDGTSP